MALRTHCDSNGGEDAEGLSTEAGYVGESMMRKGKDAAIDIDVQCRLHALISLPGAVPTADVARLSRSISLVWSSTE